MLIHEYQLALLAEDRVRLIKCELVRELTELLPTDARPRYVDEAVDHAIASGLRSEQCVMDFVRVTTSLHVEFGLRLSSWRINDVLQADGLTDRQKIDQIASLLNILREVLSRASEEMVLQVAFGTRQRL